MSEDARAEVSKVLVHRVVGNSDTTEGKGREYTIGWFINLAAARLAAKGQGVMGFDAHIESRERSVVTFNNATFLVGDRIDRGVEDLERAIRERALAKLTDVERSVLGLVDATERSRG